MHLCELHPSDHPILASLFAKNRHIRIEKGDGFAAVKAQLPPMQKTWTYFNGSTLRS